MILGLSFWQAGLRLALILIFAAGLTLFGNGVLIKTKAMLAQILLERAFAQPSDAIAKPWPWADVEADARLSVPRLGLEQIVLSSASGEAMAFGPGHQAGTPKPGQRGTVVYSGHRDTHFSWLGKVQPGDRIFVERRNGEKIGYRVRRNFIARYDSSGIDADSDEHLIALSTCWPIDGKAPTPLRYVVEAVEL